MEKKTYYFDEKIAPLTEEEQIIMKEYKSLARKVNKIYERTDQVIKLYKKTEKEKEKKRKRKEELQKEQERKKQKQQEKIHQKQQLLEKTECFTQNYSEFKQNFYKLFDEIKLLRSNFEVTKDKENEIQKLRKTFQNKCIHPESFKTIGYYNYEIDDGGGSGFGHSTYQKRTCDACNLCTQQDDKNGTVFWHLSREDINLNFSKYTEFDSEDNIKTLNKDIKRIS